MLNCDSVYIYNYVHISCFFGMTKANTLKTELHISTYVVFGSVIEVVNSKKKMINTCNKILDGFKFDSETVMCSIVRSILKHSVFPIHLVPLNLYPVVQMVHT